MSPRPPNPQAPNPTGIAAYKPAEIAQLIEEAGVNKTRLGLAQMTALAMLAGAFIAFGAAFYTLVMTGVDPGYGPARLLGGAAFSLGLILVVVGGAELFTGNALMVMAWGSTGASLPAPCCVPGSSSISATWSARSAWRCWSATLVR